jgi:hypothetical protein
MSTLSSVHPGTTDLEDLCCAPSHFAHKLCLSTEANRKRGPGTREKVTSKRINLEGNMRTGN